jgi:hypothetical protein
MPRNLLSHALFSAALIGCAPTGQPVRGCEFDVDCVGDLVCTDGHCADSSDSDGGVPEPDGGIVADAGVIADAGIVADAGVVADAGSDGGVGADAGVVADAGNDGGVGADAGVVADAGSDGGVGADAGVVADAGNDAGPVAGWWDPGWTERLDLDVGAGSYARADQIVVTTIDFNPYLQAGALADDSIRVVEHDDTTGAVVGTAPLLSWYRADLAPNVGALVFVMPGATSAGQTRRFGVYFARDPSGIAAPAWYTSSSVSSVDRADLELWRIGVEPFNGSTPSPLGFKLDDGDGTAIVWGHGTRTDHDGLSRGGVVFGGEFGDELYTSVQAPLERVGETGLFVVEAVVSTTAALTIRQLLIGSSGGRLIVHTRLLANTAVAGLRYSDHLDGDLDGSGGESAYYEASTDLLVTTDDPLFLAVASDRPTTAREVGAVEDIRAAMRTGTLSNVETVSDDDIGLAAQWDLGALGALESVSLTEGIAFGSDEAAAKTTAKALAAPLSVVIVGATTN